MRRSVSTIIGFAAATLVSSSAMAQTVIGKNLG